MITRRLTLNIHNIPIFIFLTINTLIADTFLPPNNSELNYRQLEFSWPQIPNSDSYQLTINDINSDLSLLIDSDDNILIYDGYDLEWGESYSWQVCGYYNDGLLECHDEKYFNINELLQTILPNIDIEYYNENLIADGITVFGGWYEQSDLSLAMDNVGNILWYNDSNVIIDILNNGNYTSLSNAIGYEINLDGNIIFQTPSYDNENNSINNIHHDLTKTNNKTYFGLTNIVEVNDCPIECPPEADLIFPNGVIWEGDKILEFDSNGNVTWDWSLFEYINMNSYNSFYAENMGPHNGYILDWTHSNEVFYDENDNAVYLSIRNLNTITKIDYETKEIIWHLGDLDTLGNNSYFNNHPSFNSQHTPILLDNGNLILFDNGLLNTPQVSKCQEYSIINDNSFDLVWEYTLHDSLFTQARGECHHLINGNILIGTGQTSNILEITDTNEIIWNVVIKSTIGANTLVRVMKIDNLYPSSFNIEFDNYSGTIESPYIEIIDNNFSFNLINNGWMEDQYEISITDNNNFTYNNTVLVDANISHTMSIDISDLINTGQNNSDLTIEIYSTNKDLSYLYNVLLDYTLLDNYNYELTDYNIANIYPNPFNPVVNFDITIPSYSNIAINIYNLKGDLVENIFSGSKNSGIYSLSWNASSYASGVYFIQLETDNAIFNKKVTLIK